MFWGLTFLVAFHFSYDFLRIFKFILWEKICFTAFTFVYIEGQIDIG